MTAATPNVTLPEPVAHPQLDSLIAVAEHLRAPGGCAWDRDQTHATLVQYLVEETHELIEAIEAGDDETSLHERIKSVEHELLVSVVTSLCRHDVQVIGREVVFS